MDKTRNSELIAVVGLLLAALFWGFGYPLTKYAENCPTFFIISIRFIAAAVAMIILFFKKFKKMHFDVIKYSFILSFVLLLMYVFSVIGIKYTTSVRASFLSTLSFLVVPIINYFAYKIKISKIIIISALICLVGTFMLCYSPDIGGLVINMGDILCLLTSVAGAVNIILIEYAVCKDTVDSTLFTTFLMIFVAIWSTIIALFTGDLSYTPSSSTEVIAVIIMGLVSGAGAFVLQAHFEQKVPSNRVGIIFSFEPASGCILSVLILHESLSIIGWLGAAVIMFSIFFMEYTNSKFKED